MGLLTGKRALVVGIANKRSLAWGIAQALHREGAELCLTYQNERLGENVAELAKTLDQDFLVQLDVQKDSEIEALFRQIRSRWDGLDILIHSVAYANREDLEGEFINVSRQGFLLAHDISAYSLVALARGARPLMNQAQGGSIVALTYLASQRVVPNYNVMAPAKASLEATVRYLAHDLGPENIRVNAISAGAVKTLASSAVRGISGALAASREKAPLRRNIDNTDIGDAALFLCSDLARNITGHILYVDAGYHLLGV